MQIDRLEQQAAAALRPSAAAIGAMPLSDNAAIAGELLPGGARTLLDIGCGGGKFTRLMAQRGMRATGIDPKDEAIAEARALAAKAGLQIDFQTGRAESLAFADGAFDIVVFSNSLHHMSDCRLALAEAVRVLAPGGSLYVMEPVAWGSYHAATKLVNDESAVREAAYRALLAFAAEGALRFETERLYKVRRLFARYEDWMDDQVARNEKRRRVFEENGPAIRAAFEEAAGQESDGLSLHQIFRVDLLLKR